MLANLQHMFRTPFYRRAWMVLAISLLIIIALGQFTSIDLFIEDYYYDEALQIFPWKDSWFANDLMHRMVKNVTMKIGYLVLILVVLDGVFKFSWIDSAKRWRLRFVGLAALLVPFFIRSIKQFSVLHCPWDIDRYGGEAPFYRLLDSALANVDAGHCFPAGHATAGLWMAAFCIFWFPHRPKTAFWVFIAGLSIGLVMGWVQQMRGAHFLFHTLWSGWLASFVILMMLVSAYKLLDGEKT